MALTEEETEYAVNVVKHVYPGHVVLQFNCTNTIAEHLLENVSYCSAIFLAFGVKFHIFGVRCSQLKI